MRYRGNQREQAVARLLRELGYLVASLRHVGGPADLLAISPKFIHAITPTGELHAPVNSLEPGAALAVVGEPRAAVRYDTPRPLLVEVKGTKEYPWRSTWGPSCRAEMIEAGIRWDVEPMLAWWPPHYGPIWLPVEDWPA